MKLWAMLCMATQDGWVMVESSDKTWSTGEGNGKPLQYSCLENPRSSMKRPKDRTLKDELPGQFGSVQFSSVSQSCPTLCDPMNRSTPGLPAHHQLPEFTQTHVHRVADAIQPSHPLSSPSSPAPNPSQKRPWWVFSSESTLRLRWPKYWSFSFSISPSREHPGIISFRIGARYCYWRSVEK